MSHSDDYEVNPAYLPIKGSQKFPIIVEPEQNTKPLKRCRPRITCCLLYSLILFISLAGSGLSIFSYLELQKVQNQLKQKEIKLPESESNHTAVQTARAIDTNIHERIQQLNESLSDLQNETFYSSRAKVASEQQFSDLLNKLNITNIKEVNDIRSILANHTAVQTTQAIERKIRERIQQLNESLSDLQNETFFLSRAKIASEQQFSDLHFILNKLNITNIKEENDIQSILANYTAMQAIHAMNFQTTFERIQWLNKSLSNLESRIASLNRTKILSQQQLSDLVSSLFQVNMTNLREINNIQSILETQNNRIVSLQSSLNTVITHSNNAVSMVTYIRWGHNTCPSGRTTVYSGRVGGTAYTHQGGAANQVCLPEDPQYYSSFRSGSQGYSIMYGSEYEQPLSSNAATQDNVPCAVCSVTTRQQVLMIPARYTCPSGWTREYNGYLMSEAVSNYRSSFICVDSNQIPIPNTQVHNLATDLYHVEADCSNLPCGPYSSEKELTCVVCTK